MQQNPNVYSSFEKTLIAFYGRKNIIKTNYNIQIFQSDMHKGEREGVMNYMLVSPQNSHIETLIPRVMVFEDGAFGR